MKTTISTIFFVSAMFAGTAALAHDGPAILQMGGASERVSHGERFACAEQRGAHLCKGAESQTTELEFAPAARVVERVIERETRIIIRRPLLRALRTQGIYSGDVYPSRRFTQGFYSNRVARGR